MHRRSFLVSAAKMVATGACLGANPIWCTSAIAANPAERFRQIADQSAEEEAYATGLEAYLYGYPRVELDRRIYNETHRVKADQVIYAPRNQFFYFDRLSRPGDGLIIKAPNNDTLYASAYLDLLDGPVALHVPEVGHRHYVALIVDAAGGVDNRLSRSVSGAGGVTYLFAGPGFKEPIPAGVKMVHVATNDLWLLMRLTSDGSMDDQSRAALLLRKFTLMTFGDGSTLDRMPGRNADVLHQPLAKPLDPMGRLEFFGVLAEMLRRNPVPEQDRGLVERWRRIGVGGGRFDAGNAGGPVRRGLERAIVAAEKIIAAAQFGIAITINGWNYSDKIGRIRNDWALNAAIARGGYGNLAEDSVYHQRNLDASGTPLAGARRYTITFPEGQLPPVKAFWSLTAYDQASFDLMENEISRYSIGDRTPGLRRGSNGSLTIAIQHQPPADPILRANWLPVGTGAFYLNLRTYDPSPEIARGEWGPPEIEVHA